MEKRTFISLVSPVYQAAQIVPALVNETRAALEKLDVAFEIVLVEDGSKDDSWRSIEEECKKDERVKGVKLSRNFGQHKAITAGLATSKGTHIVVMDCDLQDDPSDIEALLKKSQEGYDIVYTMKKSREHGLFKNITARLFHWLFNLLVDNVEVKHNYLIGSFSLVTRKVVNEFLRVGDHRRNYLSVLRWLGFKNAFVVVNHRKRHSGKTSYNLRRLFLHAIDGITSQSDKLLYLTVLLGFGFAFLAVIATISIVVLYFVHGFQSGWASLATLILFSLGVIVTTIGIVGVYVGRTFEQSKGRQIYVVDVLLNSNDDK